ncbi:MAG TPA: nucleoside-diphosphate kinase [Candidatus Saccharimonadales bacterium]|nr:nucleoside-diphosphate kinase [Candidatus Saccharimonadales bacterium]
MERTLVILKPDAVRRGLTGEIISRFEKTGLKMIGAKMITPDRELANKHYPVDRREFIEGMGHKSLQNYKEQGGDAKKELGTDDPHAIGLQIQAWMVDFITSGPVLAIVLEGPHAVEIVRKIVGHTLPLKAEPGTIRGDYSYDSPTLANKEKRPIYNLIHASGDKKEAEFEIGLWFSDSELHS